MNTLRVKKGDTVLIVSGKDRGKKGKIMRVLPETNQIVIEGLNMRRKHIRAKKAKEKGQTISLAAPLYVSNVKMLCPKCGKAVRIGFKVEGGKKYRVCKSCNNEL